MNVEVSLVWQLSCFSVCGMLLGVGYELLRIIRTVIPHHSFAVGVEDTFIFHSADLCCLDFPWKSETATFAQRICCLPLSVLYYTFLLSEDFSGLYIPWS